MLEWTYPVIIIANFSVIGFLIKHMLDNIYKKFEETSEKISKVCSENTRAHNELWGRTNFHKHDKDGFVVITEAMIAMGSKER